MCFGGGWNGHGTWPFHNVNTTGVLSGSESLVVNLLGSITDVEIAESISETTI